MKLSKQEAKEIFNWKTKGHNFENIQKRFLKKYKHSLFSDDDETVSQEVARKLKIDINIILTKKEKEDVDILWKIYGPNKKCEQCIKKCKQHAGSIVQYCPLYEQE